MRRVLSGEISAVEKEIFLISHGKKIPLSEVGDIGEFEPIGSGSQSRVWAVEVKFTIDGQEQTHLCALKEIPREVNRLVASSSETHGNAANFFLEHAAATASDNASTDHNLVKLIEVITHNEKKYALMSYCPFFLEDLLDEHDTNDTELQHVIILQVVLDVLYALNHLHNNLGRIHGDVNLLNIDWYEDSFGLADFDNARPINSPVTTAFGAYYYKHPASFADPTKYGSHPCNDIYALGKVLERLIPREEPSPRLPSEAEFIRTKTEQYRRAAAQSRDEKQSLLSEIVNTLLATMVSFSGRKRKNNLRNGILLTIANAMTDILPERQPDIPELILAFNGIKQDLLNSLDIDEKKDIKRELVRIYNKISQQRAEKLLGFRLPTSPSLLPSFFTNTPPSPTERRERRLSDSISSVAGSSINSASFLAGSLSALRSESAESFQSLPGSPPKATG